MSLDKAIEIAEPLGWSVRTRQEQEERYITFTQASPAGEDFSFVIWTNKDECIAEEVRSYARDFDVEEHVKSMLGCSGAPSIKELVEDADRIQERVSKLAEALENGSSEECSEKCTGFLSEFQTISMGAFIKWEEMDKAVNLWANSKLGCTAEAERDDTSFEIGLHFNNATDETIKEKLDELYEKYDAEKEYEPDYDPNEILAAPIALAIANEIFERSGTNLRAKTAIALYNGILFLYEKIKF